MSIVVFYSELRNDPPFGPLYQLLLLYDRRRLIVLYQVGQSRTLRSKPVLSVVEEVISTKVVNYLLLDDFLESFGYVVCESNRPIVGRDVFVPSLEYWGNIRQVDVVRHDTTFQ